MAKEDLAKLGFTKDLEWKSEAEEKRVLIEKINELKSRAFNNVRNDLLSAEPSKP